MIKVLHINVRGSQGGAGRMALDLHRRIAAQKLYSSQLFYGYASGIQDDAALHHAPDITRIGSRATVLANYASHVAFGMDLFTSNRRMLHSAIKRSDLIHLHVPHHYYMNWLTFTNLILVERKPLVVTAHDWWFISGRCGFVEECTGWKRDCGECGSMRWRDLPSIFDLSRWHLQRKRASIRRLAPTSVFVCPSSHLAADYERALGNIPIAVIQNGTDLEFEKILDDSELDLKREGYLISATDLSSPGKVDRGLVRELQGSSGVQLRFIGRNNPFHVNSTNYLGEITSRAEMVRVLLSSEALIFCSQMDNAPLTLIEALVCGCFPIAYDSPAAREILARVGGKCVGGRSEALAVVRSGGYRELYGGVSPAVIASRARAVYSGRVMVEKYIETYERAMCA
jgi:putative colanic acid biosynthesis glycosyltransferase